jgi:hypothetical protein
VPFALVPLALVPLCELRRDPRPLSETGVTGGDLVRLSTLNDDRCSTDDDVDGVGDVLSVLPIDAVDGVGDCEPDG